MEITDNIASSEPIKEIRLIVDVAYLDSKVSACELIGMLSNAVQKRLMVDELACGGKVFGFSTNYLHQRSSMNDTPHIRAMALEQTAGELLIDRKLTTKKVAFVPLAAEKLSHQRTVEDLRRAGYAVVLFEPNELGVASSRSLEARLVELGTEAIADLQDHSEIEEEPENAKK